MSVDLPTWTAFDPDVAAMLPELPPPPGRVVALLSSPAAAAAGWGPRLAAGLARRWSQLGSRVVLADLGLVRPSLSAALGEPEGEGVTDVVVFGASPMRVARPIEGEAFFIVSAGTVVPDATDVLSGPRWASLCEGFREAGVLFALYLPGDEPGRAAVLRAATDVVVLAGVDEDLGELVADVEVPVRAMLGPPAAEERGIPGGAADSPHDAAPAVPAADQPARRSRSAGGAGRPSEPRSSVRTRMLLLLLVVVVVVALVAARLGLVRVPGITPPSRTSAVPTTAPAPSTAPAESLRGREVAAAEWLKARGLGETAFTDRTGSFPE